MRKRGRRMVIGFGDTNRPSNVFKLYHGSNVEVNNPKILNKAFKKDFGYGFYLTNRKRQAEIFTDKFKKFGGKGVVNVYKFNIEIYNSLNGLKFESENDEWLDFIALCRDKNRTETPHDYDWVEGPMADDQVWDHVEDFIEGRITREAFWALCKFRYPTHQICLNSERSLDVIKFLESYEVDNV